MAHTHTGPHPHEHGPGCGHTGIRHDGHVDYLHDGHLHHPGSNGEIEEHSIPVSSRNPEEGKVLSDGGAHEPDHVHGPDCGHEAVPHGDHTCYLVDGRLHHPHEDHCHDHGPVEVVHA